MEYTSACCKISTPTGPSLGVKVLDFITQVSSFNYVQPYQTDRHIGAYYEEGKSLFSFSIGLVSAAALAFDWTGKKNCESHT